MSGSSEEQSPYGRGFVAACIVVGAVLLCAALLVFGGKSTSSAASSPISQQAVVPSMPSDAAASGDPAAPATLPAGSPAAGTSQGSDGCHRAAEDQTIPETAPAVDSWEVSNRIVVPRSSAYGPATTDRDGYRRCFAHSPAGAVYAAYSAYAAMADQSRVVRTARKLMVPGPDTEALIRELEADDSTSGYSAPQLAGYRIVDAAAGRVSLMLAAAVDSDYMSLTLTLVWHAGDWRLQPPSVGEPVGAPFAQHRDLSDFVAWSGV